MAQKRLLFVDLKSVQEVGYQAESYQDLLDVPGKAKHSKSQATQVEESARHHMKSFVKQRGLCSGVNRQYTCSSNFAPITKGSH